MNIITAFKFGQSIGLIRTLKCKAGSGCDFIPVDVCVKGIILAAWKEGIKLKSNM